MAVAVPRKIIHLYKRLIIEIINYFLIEIHYYIYCIIEDKTRFIQDQI